MSEKYITLLGSEQVQSAAQLIRAAADDMLRAANVINYALEQHATVMRDFIESRVEEVKKIGGSHE